jgi:hypothetical protein
MNHRGTEITENLTESFFDLAQTALTKNETSEGGFADSRKALCFSVPSVSLW